MWWKSKPPRFDIVKERDDVLALEENRAQHTAKMKAWLASEEGQRYQTARERIGRVRDTVHLRWKLLGFEGLAEYERGYLHVWGLCCEVDTGGFDQYFYNSYSDNALSALSVLESISAARAHAVLADALSLFEKVGGFPTERPQRQDALETLGDHAFDDLTKRFYELDEDVRTLALKPVERGYERDAIPVESAEST